MIVSFVLDLIFGVERRLRERQLEIENARREQIAHARRQLIEELTEADARRGKS